MPIEIVLVAVVLAAVAIAALGGAGLAMAAVLAGAGLVFWAAHRSAGAKPGWAALGALWVGLPCVALLWLARQQTGGRVTLLWLLAVVWATDIGAYAIGRSLGGPRLAPRWSPRKTWSGFLGGVICAALAGGATALALGIASTAALMLVSAGLAIVAQFGDLAEVVSQTQVRREGFERPDPWAWWVARSSRRAARGDPGGGAADLDRGSQRPGVAMKSSAAARSIVALPLPDVCAAHATNPADATKRGVNRCDA